MSKSKRSRARRTSPALPPRRGWFWRWTRTCIVLLLLVVLLSSLPVLALRWIDPPGSAYMLARSLHYREQGVEQPVEYRWRARESISPWLAVAVIASEDQRFPDHRGFDLVEIERALAERRDRGRMRGASTISQQVARNLYLWSGQSMLRKALEAWFTLLLETFCSKQRILEVYMNIAEFADGVYGAEAAAQHHFGISAAQLDRRQAALLAAVLPSPRRYSASAPSDYVRGRADWIERQMQQLGGTALLERL